MDWSQCPEVESIPAKLGGAWVFAGTRLPISALFENLGSGATVDEFVDWFPGVAKSQVIAVLKFAAKNSRVPDTRVPA